MYNRVKQEQKLRKKMGILFFFSFISILTIAQKVEFTVHEINLLDETPSEHEEVRIVNGGKFTKEGWQSIDSLNFIMFTLKRGFGYNEQGAIELEMTNLNPETQTTGSKQHFLNLYANPFGNHFGEEWRDGKFHSKKPELPFLSLRFAKNKYTDEHGQGIKVLWKANKNRFEKEPFGTRKDWDKDKTYIWRAEWDADSLFVSLNGERIFGPADFANRDKNAMLRYVWLAKDNHFDPWFAFPGPVYKKIRIFYPEK